MFSDYRRLLVERGHRLGRVALLNSPLIMVPPSRARGLPSAWDSQHCFPLPGCGSEWWEERMRATVPLVPLVMEPGNFPHLVTGDNKVEEGLLLLVLGKELKAWKIFSSQHLPLQCFPLGQQLIPMPQFVRHNSSTIAGDSELNLTIYLCKEIGLGVRDFLLLYSKLLSHAQN